MAIRRTRELYSSTAMAPERAGAVIRGLLAMLAGLAVLAARADGQSASSGDWRQWLGPDRTGLSTESGLLRPWTGTG